MLPLLAISYRDVPAAKCALLEQAKRLALAAHGAAATQCHRNDHELILVAQAGFPELRRHLYVVESQVIATAAVPDLLERIGWRDGASICDSR